jgi:hypothetical protein
METCRLDLALDRLKTGVDNIRTDVHLSEDLYAAAETMAFNILVRQSRTGEILSIKQSPPEIQTEINAFKILCQDVMHDAVHKAKIQQEPQINTLCQVAMIKLAREISQKQFLALLNMLKRKLRDKEISDTGRQKDFLELRQRVQKVQQRKDDLVRSAAAAIVDIIRESQRGEIARIRESSFGETGQLPAAVMDNPLLNVSDTADSRLAMTEYGIITGEPVSYETMLRLTADLLRRIDTEGRSQLPLPARIITTGEAEPDAARLEPWLLVPENADVLFNYLKSEKSFRSMRKRKGTGKERRQLKRRTRHQFRIINTLKSRLRSGRLIRAINALSEARAVMPNFCPPLSPEELVQAIISGRGRRQAVAKLKKEQIKSRKKVDAKPLKAAAGKQNRLTQRQADSRLMSFMERFLRYHRDRVMWERLRDAMDNIHLVSEDRHIILSRANFTIYEFLLPHEQETETKPVINHVVIKSDVRGSTDITHRLNDAGLNPASFFSLNFFNPITESLAEYGAEKVFIEGDAIILSIFERNESPEGWYAVSRACGLAVRMIQIVQQVNKELENTDLPRLEQGIGIGFLERPPTFLFDGLTRIMISPVINLADRMSGCAKILRNGCSHDGNPFQLEVFRASTQTGDPKTADDLSLRYNVNGIEISENAFDKLAREIDLNAVNLRMPGSEGEHHLVYTGTYPTMSGRYQRLVIRKAPIAVIDPENLEVKGKTKKFFYEVCTHPELLRLADKV